MPINGQLLTNPLTGDTYEYLKTSKETKGARVIIKATVKSQGKLVPNHFHTVQDETFEIIDGQLTIWANGATRVLPAGERITLPKNKAHNHYNGHKVPVTYIHTVTPGLDFDYLIENLVGLAADGKKSGGGLVQQLVTLRYLESKSLLVDVPVAIQKILLITIPPIARLFGYRAIYKKYSGVEK